MKRVCILLVLVILLSIVPEHGGRAEIEFTRVADHLLEATVTEDADWSTEAIAMAGFSCSGIQYGQYRGRNYDWYFDDTDVCIVHTTVTENRPHASVGVADLSFITDEDGKIIESKLPFVVVDGINDAGVCIQVNVMPAGENGELIHTDTADDDLEGTHVIRLILDYADSVEEAIELLSARDIYSVMTGGENELHWMISGPASAEDSTLKTVVVEVFPDGLHITDTFVGDIPIMTNFNVSNFDGTAESIGLGSGYERWQILCENAAQASSVAGTFDLMEKVFFTKAYDLYGEIFMYSEYNIFNLCNYYSETELIALLGNETYSAYMENYGGVYYNPTLWDGEERIYGDISKTGIIAPAVEIMDAYYKSRKFGQYTWMTVHTSVYDIENLTLDIAVRESQDTFRFTIE